MKFSIFTPTKNRPDWIGRAVESVLAQTHTDWEQVILDMSDEPIRDLLPDDPRIRYVQGGTPQGPARDFQRALDLCTGDVVHPLSDDDRITPWAMTSVANAIGDARWLYGWTDTLGPDDEFMHRLGASYSLAGMRQEYNLGGAIYWRREFSDLLGGFNYEFDHAGDYDLYMRFGLNATPAYLPEVLYLYTEHGATDTNRNYATQQFAGLRVRVKYSASPAPGEIVPQAPLSLDVRSFVTFALADELAMNPGLLAAYRAAFSADTDASLLVYAPDKLAEEVVPRVEAAMAAAGFGGDESDPDLLLVTLPHTREAELVEHVDAVLTEKWIAGPWWAAKPHVGAATVGTLPARGRVRVLEAV